MKDFSAGNQSLTDLPARLADMDRAGVDVQVIYGALLYAPMTDDDFRAALEISYNKWIAGRCSEAPERLKWAASLPLRSPKAAEKEIFRVEDAGAVSLMCYGSVCDTMPHLEAREGSGDDLGARHDISKRQRAGGNTVSQPVEIIRHQGEGQEEARAPGGLI